MDVSIIIVNYNTKQLLANCLQTIYDKTQHVEFEIIVVDNASIDGSEDYITQRFPYVKWINSGENFGFGKANNLGVKSASGKYLFFLNSDTLLQNNAVCLFFEYAETHQQEHIGALGSWLLDKKERPNNSFGFFPNVKNELRYLWDKYFSHSKEKIMITMDVDYITGADLFVKKKLFEELGGFDENIFMYYEETDLQFRMSSKNLLRRIILGPRIVHLEGGSFEENGLSYRRFLMAQTSYNYYLKKNFRGISYGYSRFMICLIRLTIFITTNWRLSEKLKAYKLVLLGK